MKHVSTYEKQTLALGKKIAKQLKGGEVIGLSGRLGEGKTTLIKGIGQGLGVEQIITSPTFVIFKVYPLKNSSIRHFVHTDAYRARQWDDLVNIGLSDYLDDDSVVLIEWFDKLNIPKNEMPEKIWKIKITSPDPVKFPKKRIIEIKNP